MKLRNTFLAANSATGFVSLFGSMTQKVDHNIILIKGGPGTGKSSLMKKVASAAKQKGYTVEQMHCSSDPSSLDGVWVEEKKLILLDATAPHCADPVFPGAVEQILPLGEYWDRSKLIPHKSEIIRLTRQISSLFDRVYHLLAAAGKLRGITEKILLPAFDKGKADKMLTKFFRQQAILPTGKKSRTEERFISALGGEGKILYEDIVKDCRQVLLIEDSYDCGHLIMDRADAMLDKMGIDRLQLRCPLQPEHIDHLILPTHSTAILLQNHRLEWKSELPVVKTISLRSLTDTSALAGNKNKLSFNRKLCKALYDEVCDLLASEKTLHDQLEQYYISAMDFEALNSKTEELINTLL